MNKRCVLMEHNRSLPPGNSWKCSLWEAVAKGLRKIGCNVEYINIEACPRNELPCLGDLAFFWNGQKKARKEIRLFMESEGFDSVCVEHGWFKRHTYFHFSLGGNFGPFAHFASNIKDFVNGDSQESLDTICRVEGILGKHLTQWCLRSKPKQEPPIQAHIPVAEPNLTPADNVLDMTVLQLRSFIKQNSIVPPEVKLLQLRKHQLIEMAAKIVHPKEGPPPTTFPQLQQKPNDNYVLIVLQVAGDAQHGTHKYQPLAFAEKMLTSIRRTQNKRVVIRTHPMSSYKTVESKFAGIDGVDVHNGQEVPLNNDLNGCSYVVSFNSNVVNQAILKGIPCAVMGPHLAAIEDVTMFGQNCMDSQPELNRVITAMEEGWQIDTERAKRYLLALCGHQYCAEELATGEYLRTLVG